MSYLGSWKTDDLLSFYVNTHRLDSGAAIDADAAPTYRVYEDETATPLLTGSMALLDSSNTDGFYSEQITLSAANGFEKGKCYCIRIVAVVNGVSAVTCKTFQMEAEVDANTVSPTVSANVVQISGDATAADNLEAYTDGTTPMPVNTIQISGDATSADNAESFFDGTGYAGTNNVIPTVTNVVGIGAGGITAASIATDAIDADALKADAITEIQSGLATTSGLSTVNTNVLTAITKIDDVQADVTSIESKVDIIDTNVDSILADTNSIETKIDTIDSNVDAILIDTASIEGKVDTANAAIGVVDDKVDAIQSDLDVIDGIVDSILDDTGTSGVVIAGSQIAIKKNVARNNFVFVMTNATTHVPMSGLSVTGQISKDGGSFVNLTNSVVEISNGWYKVNLTQTETNANDIALRFTAGGADELPLSFVTQS